MKFGSGLNNTVGSGIYALGYENKFSDPFVYKIEFGGYGAGSGVGRSGAVFGATMLGIRAGSIDGLNAQLLAGTQFISQTDVALSSNFQFTEEVSVSYQSLGLGYRHISNAGITRPNLGRDYYFLNIVFPMSF